MRAALIKREWRSYRDSGDQAIDVALGIKNMRRDANIPLAESGDDVFVAQLLVQVGGLLRGAGGETAVGAAAGRVERAGRDAAVFGEALEEKIDELAIVGFDGSRSYF